MYQSQTQISDFSHKSQNRDLHIHLPPEMATTLHDQRLDLWSYFQGYLRAGIKSMLMHSPVRSAFESTPAAAPTPASPAASVNLNGEAITGSYISEATQQLLNLSHAIEQDPITREKLLYALKFSGGAWGRDPVPQELGPSAWISDVSNDHSPLEYSLALSQRTGEAELRFLIEAQPEENNLASLQESTLALNDDIAEEYRSTTSMERFDMIKDLFFPHDAQGALAAWHSFATSKTLEKWKLYLNPLAQGKENAASITSQALIRLGLEQSWLLLKSIMSPEDQIIYFALGLGNTPEDAEVKVYVSHPGSSATQIALKHAQMDPNASVKDIEEFYRCMGAGSLGPYPGKPALSCFAFKNKDPTRPARTILYPWTPMRRVMLRHSSV